MFSPTARATSLLLVLASVAAVARPAEAVEMTQYDVRLTFTDTTVSGQFVDEKPIRYVTVVALQEKILPVWFAQTDEDGRFTFSWPTNWDGPWTFRFLARNYAADVYCDLDGANEWFVWEYACSGNKGMSKVNYHLNVQDWNFGAHFNILSVLQRGRMYADANRAGGESESISKVDVQWPDDDEDNSYYSSYWEEIALQHDRGYNDEVALHEFGHHVMYEISDVDTGTDPDGHFVHVGYGYPFAWSEGFAYYFAYATQRAFPGTVQAGFSKDIEGKPLAAPDSELRTMNVLWDTLDEKGSGEDAHDRIDGSEASKDRAMIILDADMDDQDEISIRGFHGAWKKRYSNLHADLDRIMYAYEIGIHTAPDYQILSSTTGKSSYHAGDTLTASIQCYQGPWSPGYPGTEVQIKVELLRPTGPLSAELYDIGTDIVPFGGSFQTVSFQTKLPKGLPSGDYLMRVTIDPKDQVYELNEKNNTHSAPWIKIVP